MPSITSSVKRTILVSAAVLSGLVAPLMASPAIASLAISDYDGELATKATTADDFYSRGIYFQGQGNLETAIAQFDQAIALDQNNPDYYFSRGLTHADMGDHRAAQQDYSAALAIDATFAAAYYQRGLSQIIIPVAGVSNLEKPAIAKGQHGQVNQAIHDFSMALQHSPDFVAAHYYRGLSHYVLGHEALAIADYQQARQLNPEIAESFYRHGFTQLYIGGPRVPQ